MNLKPYSFYSPMIARLFGYSLLVILFFLVACSNHDEDKCAIQPNAVKITVTLEQFQEKLAGISSKRELVELLTQQPLLRDFVFRRADYPNDSAFINKIYSRLTNPHFDTLLLETQRVFSDGSGLKHQFEQAFGNLKYYYPDFEVPKIKTVISGMETDLIISDTVIIVGLDWYLGKGAKYRPNMYEYLLRKYDPDDIVPSCMLIYGISDRFNKTDLNDKTVLADMIAYGKSYYFAKHMLPCTPDSVLISYTAEEISGSRKNQDLIWARFIESQVLYATSHVVKKDYLGERPYTIQVGEKCPGRIGQWVGWEIVKKYMETHPNTSLQQLMQYENAQKLFKESQYKPKKR